jgi:hypothetical protein
MLHWPPQLSCRVVTRALSAQWECDPHPGSQEQHAGQSQSPKDSQCRTNSAGGDDQLAHRFSDAIVWFQTNMSGEYANAALRFQIFPTAAAALTQAVRRLTAFAATSRGAGTAVAHWTP